MKTIDVWVVEETDYDGHPTTLVGVFTSESEAKAADGIYRRATKRRGIAATMKNRAEPETIYLVDETYRSAYPVNLDLPKSKADRKAAALAKLTDADKEALGIKS